MLMGPSDHNFTEVAAAFAKADCLARVRDADELAEAVFKHLSDEPSRRQTGQRALAVVRSNGGALAKTQALLRGTSLGIEEFPRPPRNAEALETSAGYRNIELGNNRRSANGSHRRNFRPRRPAR